MRQAIITKYLGPTETLGTRIKATSASGISVTIYRDYAVDIEEDHARAAQALAEKLGWSGSWAPGELPDGRVAWIWCGSSRWAAAAGFRVEGTP